jgi:hypothetical protein
MTGFISYKKYMNEKFSEDSDPISDMGIGKLEVGDIIKLKNNLKIDKLYGDFLFLPIMKFSDEKIIKRIDGGKCFLLSNTPLYYSKEMLELVRKGSDVNESIHPLNETYESFKELSLLAKEIFFQYRDGIKFTRKIYPIKSFVSDIEIYDVLKDFIKSSTGIILGEQDDFVNPGSFMSPKTYNKFVQWIQNNKWGQDIVTAEGLQKSFNNGIILLGYSYRYERASSINIVLHELEHAYDNFRSGEKETNTTLGKRFTDKIHQGGMTSAINLYYRTPHEMSAFFVMVVNNIDFFDNHGIIKDFRTLYSEFEKEYNKITLNQYEKLTKKDKNNLLRKFSQYYYKIKEDFEKKKKK